MLNYNPPPKKKTSSPLLINIYIENLKRTRIIYKANKLLKGLIELFLDRLQNLTEHHSSGSEYLFKTWTDATTETELLLSPLTLMRRSRDKPIEHLLIHWLFFSTENFLIKIPITFKYIKFE